MKTIIKSLLVLMLFAVSEAASAIAVTIQDKEVAILNITSESVTINWKKAVRTDSQKAPLYYRVIWQQRTSGALSLPYPQDASPKMADADTYTMRHNIYPNTTYDVWIQVRDSYDGKEYLEYKSFSFTTKKSDYNAPSIKEEYSSTSLNKALNNSLDISVHYAYEPETMQASAHFDYVILYKKSSETTYKKHSCIGKNKSGAMNYYIDNLEQNTEYDILPVVTKDGKSNYYDVLTVSTANIDDVKPTITNYAVYVSGVTTNSATLKWTLATDNMTSKNDLVYHLYLMRPGQSTEKEYTVTGGNDSYTITGLQPGTAYFVTLKVTDNANNWSFYDSSDFTTKAEEKVYPIKVAGIDVKGSNRNDVLGDGGSVKYAPTSNVLTLNNVVVPESKFSGQFICVDHGGLTIKLVGNNELGSSIYANTDEDIVFTGNGTLTVKCQKPFYSEAGGLRVEGGCTVGFYAMGSGLAGTSIRVKGNITVDNSTLKARGTTGTKGGVSIYGCTGVNLIGTDYLSMHYYEKSTGMFIAGQSNEAHDEIIIGPKAPDTTAPTVSNKKYTVENKTYDGFTIRWTKGTDDVTPASDIKYTVCIVKASEYNGISWPVAASSLYDVDSYTFTNLESGETYLVKVWAYDAAGNRLEYGTAEITTLSLDKNAPFASNKDLTITNVTSDGFTINWTPAKDDITPASELQYFVCFDKLSDYGSGSDGITVIEKLKGDTSYTFTGLDPEEEYIIYITVLDAAGNWFGYNVLWNVKINNITPVESVKTDKVMNNGKMYSTAGVEVGNDYRGVVIINGKKYFKNK